MNPSLGSRDGANTGPCSSFLLEERNFKACTKFRCIPTAKVRKMPGYSHHDVLIRADLDLAVILNQDKMKDNGVDFLHLEGMYYNVPTISVVLS